MIEYLNVLYVSLCIIQLVTDKQNKGLWLILIVWLLLPQPDFIKQDIALFVTYNQLSQVLLFLLCAFISKTRIHRLKRCRCCRLKRCSCCRLKRCRFDLL